jgi:hypothetical protein
MVAMEWMLTVFAIAFAVAVGMLVWAFQRGGGLWREQACGLVCPRSSRAVECRIVQDIRTGQWKSVEACSALAPGAPWCEEECRRLMNLGLQRPQSARAA